MKHLSSRCSFTLMTPLTSAIALAASLPALLACAACTSPKAEGGGGSLPANHEGGDPYEGLPCKEDATTPPDNGYFSQVPVDVPGTGYQVSDVLGTGDMICYASDDVEVAPIGDYVWKRTWGTDFGAIDDDDFMNMTITVDPGFSADGIIYVEGKGENKGATRRAFARHDGVPCQPAGVEIPEFIVPHGDPALLGRSFFIDLLFTQQDEDAGVDAYGSSGIFYWDYQLQSLYPVADNRPGSGSPSPASYTDGHGQSYECKTRWGVPSVACGQNEDECVWTRFELLMASNRKDTALFRGTYLADDGKEYRGLFALGVEREPVGDTERLSFDERAIVDPAAKPLVPDQPATVAFESVTDAWINEAGVVVFIATYDGIGALGDHGIFAAYDGSFYRIVDNRKATTGTSFKSFAPQLEEVGPGEVDDSAHTRGTTNIFVNNAGPNGLGNVFFTATVHATTEGRESGLFVAVPSLNGSDLSYEVHNLVESGHDSYGGTKLGFFCGPFNSIAANDNNQVLFKSLRIKDETVGPGIVLDANRPAHLMLYDGSTDLTGGGVTVFKLPDAALPQEGNSQYLDEGKCVTNDMWYILSAFGLNNHGSFLFRAGCLHSGNITAWAVFKAEPQGD